MLLSWIVEFRADWPDGAWIFCGLARSLRIGRPEGLWDRSLGGLEGEAGATQGWRVVTERSRAEGDDGAEQGRDDGAEAAGAACGGSAGVESSRPCGAESSPGALRSRVTTRKPCGAESSPGSPLRRRGHSPGGQDNPQRSGQSAKDPGGVWTICPELKIRHGLASFRADSPLVPVRIGQFFADWLANP